MSYHCYLLCQPFEYIFRYRYLSMHSIYTYIFGRFQFSDGSVTHLVPLVSSIPPEKLRKQEGFLGVKKETSGIECGNVENAFRLYRGKILMLFTSKQSVSGGSSSLPIENTRRKLIMISQWIY